MEVNKKNKKVLKLFVPGRLCLLGEHSDWAGMHRMVNADVLPGYAIVSGIEQGIYATVEQSDKFIVESTLPIFQDDRFEAEMNRDRLLAVAKQGGFFSYVAGVASYINDNYTVGGLKITITEMDLPVQSGLSSSAAICVLVARAFNQMYKLKMNTQGEMLVAFRGEQKTPSRCGRLDQACAYGIKPVLMEFDGIEVNSRQLEIGTTFYWAIADLNSHKDTVRILADLNKCFPFATNEKEQKVQEALGRDNKEIIDQAVTCLQEGDACALGQLMKRAQALFDEKVAPASPEELRAPVLHSILEDSKIKAWVYGAKGVGSQGDGTVQFLCRDAESREKLMEYLRDEKGMRSFPLTLKPGQSVKKAIIPVAGFGTRLYPATKGIKKDFMPLIDRDGIIKPAILILLEQLEEAGIEQVCLVIGAEEQEEYEQFFRVLPEEHMQKLNDEKRFYEEKIVRLGKKITYVYQRERLGFGHAVFQCRAFTENEPVLLLLGDMVYQSFSEDNCSKQLIQAFEQCGKTLVSIHEIPEDDVMHYGILHGQWDNEEETLLKADQIYEKPTRDYAREYLRVKSAKGDKQYYAVFGQYVLTPAVFAELESNIRNNQMAHGEFQLTDALDQVREKFGLYGYKPNGKSFDLGLPEAYRETMWVFGRNIHNSDPDLQNTGELQR